jgi:hypothetical protein
MIWKEGIFRNQVLKFFNEMDMVDENEDNSWEGVDRMGVELEENNMETLETMPREVLESFQESKMQVDSQECFLILDAHPMTDVGY